MKLLFNLDAGDAVRWITVCLLILAVQVSLESIFHFHLYTDGNLLSWKIYQRKKSPLRTSVKENFFHFAFRFPNFLFLSAIRILLAIGCFLSLSNGYIYYWIIPFLLTSILTGMRNRYANNGSDQLATMLLIVISIIYLTGNQGFIRDISLFFIACQASLAYLTSGFFKLIVPQWRNGVFLKEVMSTVTFGHKHLKYVLDHYKWSYTVISIAVILWELLLGVAFLLPPGICLFIMAGGVLFHISVAVIMGFNTFIWAFLATYPAIYLIAIKIH